MAYFGCSACSAMHDDDEGQDTRYDRLSHDAPRSSRSRGGSRRARSKTEATNPHDVDACKQLALRYIGMQSRSVRAMQGYLAGKGYAPDCIQTVLDCLIELALLDDVEYGRRLVEIAAHRMMGFRGALYELTRKGVDRQLAYQLCQEGQDQGVFEEAAWQLARDVSRKTQGLEPEQRKQRWWATASRKGHEGSVIRQIDEAMFRL